MTRVFYVPLRQHRVERILNKSLNRRLTLEEKILLPLLPGFELATFRSRVRRSTNKLSWLPPPMWSPDIMIKFVLLFLPVWPTNAKAKLPYCPLPTWPPYPSPDSVKIHKRLERTSLFLIRQHKTTCKCSKKNLFVKQINVQILVQILQLQL